MCRTPGPGQQVIPLLHLLHRPGEDRLGLAHVGHHGVHQVRQALVRAEFDHFRVDHQHADFVGPAGHEHRDDDRVQADALARARPAGDQQVRQRGQVDDHRVARHVLAQEDGDAHLLRLAVGLLHDLAQADDLPLGVGHFDADGVLARDGGHDPHARHAQGDGQVVGQPRDPAQPQPGLQFDLELGNHRAGLDLHHANIESRNRGTSFPKSSPCRRTSFSCSSKRYVSPGNNSSMLGNS